MKAVRGTRDRTPEARARAPFGTRPRRTKSGAAIRATQRPPRRGRRCTARRPQMSRARSRSRGASRSPSGGQPRRRRKVRATRLHRGSSRCAHGAYARSTVPQRAREVSLVEGSARRALANVLRKRAWSGRGRASARVAPTARARSDCRCVEVLGRVLPRRRPSIRQAAASRRARSPYPATCPREMSRTPNAVGGPRTRRPRR